MDLFEYQARDMFEKHGVPVLTGATADTPEEARAAAEQIGARSGGVTVWLMGAPAPLQDQAKKCRGCGQL